MLTELGAIATWLIMFGFMLYGARYPERMTAARRAMMSDHPLTVQDVKIVRALAAFVVAICLWVWYATGDIRFALVGVPLSVTLSLGVDFIRKRGLGRLSQWRLPVRLGGMAVIGMAMAVWDDRNRAFPAGIAVIGATIILFPAMWSRLATGGMSEKREIAVTRFSGIVGSIAAAFAIAAMTYLTVRAHLHFR